MSEDTEEVAWATLLYLETGDAMSSIDWTKIDLYLSQIVDYEPEVFPTFLLIFNSSLLTLLCISIFCLIFCLFIVSFLFQRISLFSPTLTFLSVFQKKYCHQILALLFPLELLFKECISLSSWVHFQIFLSRRVKQWVYSLVTACWKLCYSGTWNFFLKSSHLL